MSDPVQTKAVFAQWEHLHTFVPVAGGQTAVVDQVTARLSDNWFWKFVGINMWLGLPILFAYRGWKTRRMLGRKSTSEPAATSTTAIQ